MRAVLPASQGSPRLGELPDPVPGPGEVRLEVRATALNRADLLQLRGLYPPPPGESEVPGLECSGVVEGLGGGVTGWRVGDRVMALLAGGGHGEKVVVPCGQLMTLPEGLSFEEGAAVPEVGVTAWTNLVHEGGLVRGESVLISAAASGVGTFATQLARELGARVAVAGRKPERLARLHELGAELAVELSDAGIGELRDWSGGAGVDLVLELAGGEHAARNLGALRTGGRMVLVGVLAGGRAEVDLARILRSRLRLIGSVLRARSRDEKARLVADFADFALPRLADGRLRAVVDRVLPFDRIAEGYEQLAAGGVLGKIVLKTAG